MKKSKYSVLGQSKTGLNYSINVQSRHQENREWEQNAGKKEGNLQHWRGTA